MTDRYILRRISIEFRKFYIAYCTTLKYRLSQSIYSTNKTAQTCQSIDRHICNFQSICLFINPISPCTWIHGQACTFFRDEPQSRVNRTRNYFFFTRKIQDKTDARTRWFIYKYKLRMGRAAGGVVIFTTLYAEAGIAYKEIAESLCSRHNVVT